MTSNVSKVSKLSLVKGLLYANSNLTTHACARSSRTDAGARNSPTAFPEKPDCFAPIARLVSLKSPTASSQWPERFDSIARKVSRTSRRAFWGDQAGHPFRPGGCPGGNNQTTKERKTRHGQENRTDSQPGRIDGSTWAYRRKRRYALVEAPRRHPRHSARIVVSHRLSPIRFLSTRPRLWLKG